LDRPVISTYIGGIPELVRPGQDGWLVPAGSAEALAIAIKEALEMPDEQLKAMGERARFRVRDRHSIDASALKIKDLITSVGMTS
jgi:colanic acid/amylovoran biosynthesis glycosyltransferase